jgi:ubiquinone/menaquinone biosynthesis C-methylase UbiE
MLEMASVRLADQRNVQYAICQDVVIPDVPSASVDVAYSLLVLQHLEREDAYLLLQELRRIMRPSGTAILSFPNLLSETYLASFREYARTRVSGVRSRARFYTAPEVECVLGAAGFKAELEVGTEIYAVAKPA